MSKCGIGLCQMSERTIFSILLISDCILVYHQMPMQHVPTTIFITALLFCLFGCMFCFNFQGCEMKGSTYHMFCIIAVCTNIATCLVETVLNNHTKRILGICEVYRTAVSVAINYVRELYFLHMARCTHLFSELFSFNFLQTHLTIIL